VATALIESLDCKCEGILLKALDSVYTCGEDGRSGKAWAKLKPDYVDASGDHLDLIILGGYYGDGRRRANISHFLLGVADRSDMTVDDYKHGTGTFKALCKVGSGYSDQSLSILQAQLDRHWKKYSEEIPPHNWASGYRPGGSSRGARTGERPDVWIEAHNSIILEVKYFCIVPSDKFNIGRTLRFPRCQNIRHDKNWNECCTYDQLQTTMDQYDPGKYRDVLAKVMTQDNSGRGTGSMKDKRKGTAVKKKRSGEVVAHFKDTDTRHVRKEFSTFNGIEFCVLGVAKPHTKAEIECEIVRHGGTKTQMYGEHTRYIVADNPKVGKVGLYIKAQEEGNPALRALRKSGKTDDAKPQYRTTNLTDIDVVHSSWLVACIEQRKILPLRPVDLLFARPRTQADQTKYYDKFGDSYRDFVEVRTHCALAVISTLSSAAMFSWSGRRRPESRLQQGRQPPRPGRCRHSQGSRERRRRHDPGRLPRGVGQGGSREGHESCEGCARRLVRRCRGPRADAEAQAQRCGRRAQGHPDGVRRRRD